ncbi:hypothetical protein [Stenotrophomonas sp. YAU14D1_LEIMI4_1]|uniref:hypothetical protein n=1 Tax=Stenotrophomonas sp. YAU14D1_LEIMI4_1 TaxID=2072407 RepID=UPI000D53C6AA|nr:hypothetical protein [Stenotrophomonas sp. YAU14D1_LEIMI4_1]AWH26971.1 hypothetical protein C1932_18625 [Stenotrophomonas sp. YAU14D1_LEIMI4_1]
MYEWQPITFSELEALVAAQLGRCTPAQQAAFARLRVPFHHVPVHRLGAVEQVWVVAHTPAGWLYYEDVEEGFETGRPDAHGVLAERGCDQLELTHLLHRLGL